MREKTPPRFRVEDLEVAIAEPVVVEAAQRVLASEAWQQIERHGVAARGVREHRESAEGDHPLVLLDRQKVRRLELVSSKAVLAKVAIGVRRHDGSIETAAGRMAGVVARVCRD